MSYRVKNFMWQLDYAGIFIYVSATSFSQTLYGRRHGFLFEDAHWLAFLYIGAITSYLSFVFTAFSRYLAPHQRPEIVRIVCYATSLIFCDLPILHRLLFAAPGPFDLADRGLVYWRIWLSLCLLAGFFMGSFLPEKARPGVGDLCFRSHHMSHVITGVAAFVQHSALHEVGRYFKQKSRPFPISCPCLIFVRSQ